MKLKYGVVKDIATHYKTEAATVRCWRRTCCGGEERLSVRPRAPDVGMADCSFERRLGHVAATRKESIARCLFAG